MERPGLLIPGRWSISLISESHDYVGLLKVLILFVFIGV